jgi:hypothetical protein
VARVPDAGGWTLVSLVPIALQAAAGRAEERAMQLEPMPPAVRFDV